MSYEPFPRGIYLFVKYHGSKAEQCFTNEFNGIVFRQDLTRMKFPHPRLINTRLAPGALVVIWWPDVSPTTHDMLYKTLKNCTNAASLSVLTQLSISLLALREIEDGGKAPKLLACTKQDNIDLPNLRGLPPPAKRRKLSAGSLPKLELSQFDRSDRLISTTGIISTARKRTWDGHLVPSKSSTTVPQQTEVLSFIRPSQRTTHALPPKPPTSPPPTRNTAETVPREPAIARPRSHLPGMMRGRASELSPASAPPEAPANTLHLTKDAELETLRKRVKAMEEMLRIQFNVKVRLDETANNLEAEKEARKKLEEVAAAARQGEADARWSLDEMQKLLTEEGHRRHDANERAAALQGDLVAYQDIARQQRAEFVHEYARMQDALSRTEGELNVTRPELKRVERDLEEEKARRRRYQDRLTRAERREAKLKQRCDEAMQEIASLISARERAELEARVAQERSNDALHLREESTQARNKMLSEVENAMHAAQASEFALRNRFEQVEDQLSKVETQLKTEMRLRREAEDAIADIRRECREPFVVPSLLDAFVELAKLTTAATMSSGFDTRIDGNVDKDRLRLTPAAMDVGNRDTTTNTSTTASGTSTNEVQKHPRYRLCSPHYRPRSPRYSEPFSRQHSTDLQTP